MEEIGTEQAEQKKKRFRIKPQWIAIVIISIGILSLCGAGLVKLSTMLDKRDATIITSSTLTDTINISELSTAEFIYNGIAQTYKDDKKEEVECNIKYYATVKAGVDMKAVTFDIDDENKTVKPKLPEIKITSNVVDTEQIDFIPSDSKIDLREAIEVCEKDAKEESKKATKLTETAEESLKANIEGLLMPIINKQGYTIVWK